MLNIWNLLVVCVFLCQVILGAFADEDIKESSNVLVRSRRVITMLRSGDRPTTIEANPWVVNIKKNHIHHCVGSILSQHIAITIPRCITSRMNIYTIFSGTALLSGDGKMHFMKSKAERFAGNRNEDVNGVALFTVDPPFVYSQTTHNIKLHTEILMPVITSASVTGWGHNVGRETGTRYSTQLRSINVPIISHRDCVNLYRGFEQIFDSDICTIDRYKHTGHTDFGAPLVINNTLVGINLWGGKVAFVDKPDVYALVQHPDYSSWIMRNLESRNGLH